MKVAKDTVVGIEYSLHLGDGQIIDSSDGEPLRYLQGAGQIVPGLETALEGCEPGAEKKVVVPPEQGYGERDAQAVRVVPREAFPPDAPVQAGAEFFVVDDQSNQVPLRISEVNGSNVTVDFNHPLAGKTLHFSVKVLDVRAATPDELEHGHAHGEGGEEDEDDDHHHD
jgi:FKBP-type peptidyl-prolyl cis-trans isomerase SlyD